MCYYDPKQFFLENINMGNQKHTEFYVDFKFMPTETNAPKKATAKKLCIFKYFRFCAFFHCFVLLTFVRGISESQHPRI